MRGRDDQWDGLFSYVRLEKRIPEDHPLRPIRKLVDDVLAVMNGRFEALYSVTGRPSIAPEMLLSRQGQSRSRLHLHRRCLQPDPQPKIMAAAA